MGESPLISLNGHGTILSVLFQDLVDNIEHQVERAEACVQKRLVTTYTTQATVLKKKNRKVLIMTYMLPLL